MLYQFSFIGTILAAPFLTSALALESRQSVAASIPCGNIHIIGVRGTGGQCDQPVPANQTNYGSAGLGDFITALKQGITTNKNPNVDDEPLPYPACSGVEGSTNQFSYADSVNSGDMYLSNLIGQYVDKYQKQVPKSCKTPARIVLVGYSQGGQIVADTLCGNSEKPTGAQNFTPYPRVSNALAKYIVAATMFADPTFNTGYPGSSGGLIPCWGAHDSGTVDKSEKGGVFTRQNLDACTRFCDGRARSWCKVADEFCDSGPRSGIHTSYFDGPNNYIDEGVAFVKQLTDASAPS